MSNDIQKVEKKIKILFFVDRFLRGGIQTFIWNHINQLLEKNVEIDCLILDDGKKYEMEDELKKIGINIYQLNGVWPDTLVGYMKFISACRNFFAIHNEYDIVHIHSSSKALPVAFFARYVGVSIVIAHSHTIQFQTHNRIKRIIGDFFKVLYRNCCTNYMACSKEAACWLFGKKIVSDNKCYIIANGIDFDKFKYNKNIDKALRGKYGMEGKFVIGNVSRFNPEKNHLFILDVFYEYHKINRESMLFFVGKGPYENIIRDKIEKLGIEKSVVLAGYHDNISDYLNAMDLFLFPSKFEGLGIALLEAQANGLPCITSYGKVPKEVDVSGHVLYLSLEDSPMEWAEKIKNMSPARYEMHNMWKSKFSIMNTSKRLLSIYEALLS